MCRGHYTCVITACICICITKLFPTSTWSPNRGNFVEWALILLLCMLQVLSSERSNFHSMVKFNERNACPTKECTRQLSAFNSFDGVCKIHNPDFELPVWSLQTGARSPLTNVFKKFSLHWQIVHSGLAESVDKEALASHCGLPYLLFHSFDHLTQTTVVALPLIICLLSILLRNQTSALLSGHLAIGHELKDLNGMPHAARRN